MKAAILTKTGFEIQEVPKPQARDHELLIRITSSGVCSGDVYVYQNRDKLAEKYPRLGHEASGVVEAVGTAVEGFAIGDIITTFGTQAYAEYIATPADTVAKLPASVEPKYALGEAIACCVHAGNRFGTKPGDRVAVIGCGFMGTVCLEIAKYQKAGFIVAIDPIGERREVALKYGADAAISPNDLGIEEILDQYGEFDVVIEAVGNQSALNLCTALVKIHGRIIVVGYHQSNDGLRTVNMERWNYKAIDVINGHVRWADEKLAAMQQGITLMADGHLQTKLMVTCYPFSEISTAFQDLLSRKENLIKAVIELDKNPT